MKILLVVAVLNLAIDSSFRGGRASVRGAILGELRRIGFKFEKMGHNVGCHEIQIPHFACIVFNHVRLRLRGRWIQTLVQFEKL